MKRLNRDTSGGKKGSQHEWEEQEKETGESMVNIYYILHAHMKMTWATYTICTYEDVMVNMYYMYI